jgi:hypothetical protein
MARSKYPIAFCELSNKGYVMGPLKISFINFSGSAFELSSTYTGYLHQGGDNVPSQPLNELTAFGGSTSIEIDELNLDALGKVNEYVYCGWITPSGTQFGLKIIAPFQMLDMGDRPYYQVAYGPVTPDWITAVDDPSDNYTFPSSVGYEILCQPVSTHTSLVLSVSITDLEN